MKCSQEEEDTVDESMSELTCYCLGGVDSAVKLMIVVLPSLNDGAQRMLPLQKESFLFVLSVTALILMSTNAGQFVEFRPAVLLRLLCWHLLSCETPSCFSSALLAARSERRGVKNAA